MPNDSTPVAPVTLWREHYYMAAVVNGVKEPEFSYQQRANETFAFPDSPWLALPADVLTALIEALRYVVEAGTCSHEPQGDMMDSVCSGWHVDVVDAIEKARTALARIEVGK